MRRLLIAFTLFAASALAQCSGYGAFVTLAVGTVTGTLTNFPLIVTGTFTGLKTVANGGYVQNSSGFDVCFSDGGNTTKYTWQTRGWNGTTGVAIYVVKVPSMATGTILKLWAGNVSVTAFQGGTATAVWNSNYKGVYPLQETCTPNASTAGCFQDATSGAHHSTGGKYPTQVAGVIGNAQSFSAASSQFIQAVSSLVIGTTSTLSAWLQFGSDTGALQATYDVRTATGSNGCVGAINTTTFHNWSYCNDRGPVTAGVGLNDGAWHLIAQVETGGNVTSYVDGVSQGVSSTGGGLNSYVGSTSVWIGASIGTQAFLNSTIQEVRVSDAARSAGDLLAEYNNMIAPTSFVTQGTWATVTVCAISTTSLPNGQVSIAYSQTLIGSVNCTSPSWSMPVGSLPTGLSLNSSTGAITGTPTTAATSSFTIAVTSANGPDSKSLSITTVIVPLISAVSASGNSPSSLLVQWTTDINSSSQVECGTVTGGPYSYQTTEVYTSSSGPGNGVTSHAMVIPGLPTNTSPTAYFCKGLSRQPSNSFGTSAEVSAGTLAAMTSTPLTAALSPVTRYNDQYNGVNGLPDRGIAANGDTYYPTMWADDGKLYGAANDTGGLAAGHGLYSGFGTGSNLAIFSTSPANGTPQAAVASLLTMTQANTMTNFGSEARTNTCTNGTTVGLGCWTDGASWKSGNGIGFNGKLVQHVMRQGSGMGLWGDASLIVSSDHGATWLAPQNYPGGTPQANGDPPTGGTGMWMGYGSGNNCANATIPQHGQDYGFTNPQNFVNYGNADAFVYLICYRGDVGFAFLARVRVEDFLLLDVTKYQYYTGGDGLLDVNWTNTAAGAVAIGVLSTGAGNGVCIQGAEFIPDFNRWIFTCGPGPRNAGAAAVVVLDAPYPWGPYTVAGGAPRVQSMLNYMSGFTVPLASTYSRLSSSPLVSSIVIMTSGTTNGQTASAPATDEYSPHWFTARLVPAVSIPQRSLVGNGRNQHVHAGLDLFYNFQGGTSSSGTGFSGAKGPYDSFTIPDLSPNGSYSISLPVTTPAIFDQHGMVNFGFWRGYAANCSPACDLPDAYTLTTPYTPANTAFTLAVVFAHYPNSLAIVANECVLDKGDISICRNGSVANSWTARVGATTTAAFALATDVPAAGTTWPALFLRWDGAKIDVIDSTGAMVPITTRATGTYSGALGTSALILGSLTGGTQPFYGTMSELLVWNRALGDSEIAREANAIRHDMVLRGVVLP